MESTDDFLVVAPLGDLADTLSREVFLCHAKFPDWPISLMLIKQEEEVYCYLNVCPHARHPLNLGDHQFLSKEKDGILCRSHVARFKVDSGVCFLGPCVGQVLSRLNTIVRNGFILVSRIDFERVAQEVFF